MNTSNERFPQQEAPEKNTDHAFVQVGKDGKAVMPQTSNNTEAIDQKTPAEKDEEK